MIQPLIKYINNTIELETKKISYLVSDQAPSTELDLFNSTSLVIWSGASDSTVFQDSKINHAFRALHDQYHLITGLGFSVDQEIEIGKRQAALYSSRCKSLFAELIYTEVSRQAEYFLINGTFVSNQLEFTKRFISGL